MVPETLIQSLIPIPGFDAAAFQEVHQQQQPPVSIRVNMPKWQQIEDPVSYSDKIPWCETGFYLPSRPVFTLDPLLHAGAYYVQEASSMFLEQAIQYILEQGPVSKVLDLCAAPGGKSTHLAALLPDSAVLVSNEVIQSRAAVLLENIIKWGNANVMVTQNDPAVFGKIGPLFDVMVVDAPCSGSGLFRRDPDAISEWSEQAVSLCAQRQQRILADALPALVPGGFLIYATCSYSPTEDEEILDWLVEHSDMQSVLLPRAFEMEGVVATISPKAKATGYRFFPHLVKGEGFFLAVLQKKGECTEKRGKERNAKPLQIHGSVSDWMIQEHNLLFYKKKETIYGMTPVLHELFQKLQPILNIRKSGVKIADEVHGKWNPHHDFAVSRSINQAAFSRVSANLSQALQFLRRQDADDWDLPEKGWLLVIYKGLQIGWIKNLGNRYNNYYPAAWRIRMQDK